MVKDGSAVVFYWGGCQTAEPYFPPPERPVRGNTLLPQEYFTQDEGTLMKQTGCWEVRLGIPFFTPVTCGPLCGSCFLWVPVFETKVCLCPMTAPSVCP